MCPLAKQSHLKFPSSFISTIRCFELTHFDIWGPYIKNHSSGAKKFPTVVDSFFLKYMGISNATQK